MTRAHSFPRAADFRAEQLPRNSPFRGMPRNLTFFIWTTIF